MLGFCNRHPIMSFELGNFQLQMMVLFFSFGECDYDALQFSLSLHQFLDSRFLHFADANGDPFTKMLS